jgi:hypothetical protein
MLDLARFQALLNEFQFDKLFNVLGWDHAGSRPVPMLVGDETYTLTPVAQKRGVVIYQCAPDSAGNIPPRAIQLKIEKEAAKLAHEHLLIFADAAKTTQTWLWVSRAPGAPAATRTHTWHKGASGEALRQKLEHIAFSLDEEESLTLTLTTQRLRDAFDRDRVTKRFYERFSSEHQAFAGFIEGIREVAHREWYASLMLNRLMFVYFIQRKGFLDGNIDYLADRLRRVQAEVGKGKFHSFYRRFLRRLFHEGLGKSKPRGAELDTLLGDIPYLNGGLFDVHELEEAHPEIDIPDEAFEKLFEFFGAYDWHLDDRPLSSGSEINPDVLGYIFEKYINQKQMGAYYTKEDITEYIARNTVIPHLLERTRERCKVAFEGEASVWSLLAADPDRYIYPAMKRGVVDARGNVVPESALPDFVQTGMNDAKARMFDKRYNLGEAVFTTASGERGTLPTETWREYVERRNRCLAIREKLARGEVREIDDLVTLNLDIRQFMQDVIEQAGGPELLRAVWQAIVGRVPEKASEKFRHGIAILDPTCGSGAFLFAALTILEPLYEACIERMEGFVEDAPSPSPQSDGGPGVKTQFPDFRKTLAEIAQHPSPRYYIYKNIILHNLFGVDIMPEAVEICKLRLFLKLVSQVDAAAQLEPLPDIDFNIRAGNTLVGYATIEQLRSSANLASDPDHLKEIEARAADLSDAFDRFREQQTVRGGKVTAEDKRGLRERLSSLAGELDRYLAGEYGIDPVRKKAFAAWQASHQPFHWFAEFNGVMAEGGFDAVIGNPPYKDLKTTATYDLKGFSTLTTKNLYPLVLERGFDLVCSAGRLGWIVPVSSISTEGYTPLQDIVFRRSGHFSSYDDRPSRLFDGLEHIQLTIHLVQAQIKTEPTWFVTECYRWNALERPQLFQTLGYEAVNKSYLPGCVAKISSRLEHSILDKVWNDKMSIGVQVQRNGRHIAYYSRKVHNFLQALDFTPEVFDGRGNLRPPTELKELAFSEKTHSDASFCLLNSTLFRWYINVFTDCRHVNKRETEGFRFDLNKATLTHRKTWDDVAVSLSQSLRETSEYRSMKFKHDHLRVQCIIPKKSKAIIDRIDGLLAVHYGFTEEETDFLINYDIKYRMGTADEEE